MGEPISYAGRNKGLYVMLDAHSDLFTTTSLEQDYTSFTGLISYSGSFPYMANEGFEIVPGHHNIISLSALRVNADDSMHDLNIQSRNCRFYDESSDLIIFKNYTYANCLFECGLLKAKEVFQCSPWYFPAIQESKKICDPWDNKNFLYYMDSFKETNCPNCLPECNATLYDVSINKVAFRKCDSANTAMSFLCKFNGIWDKPLPKKYFSLLTNVTSIDDVHDPTSVSNIRTYNNLNKYSWTEKIPAKYDAFDVDIATVDISFRKPKALQIQPKLKMNWIDFLSTIGGLLGLVLGMGVVSFIEICWLCIRMIARLYNLNQWIA